jgi:hypothetical protein
MSGSGSKKEEGHRCGASGTGVVEEGERQDPGVAKHDEEDQDPWVPGLCSTPKKKTTSKDSGSNKGTESCL